MVLYPAIDIRGGHAVRLERGEYGRETVYDADPVDAARRWVEQGASFLHVVDLDGARFGEPENLEHVSRIASEVSAPIQLGGGLRDAWTVAEALAAGAERVVLGTAALARPGARRGARRRARGADRRRRRRSLGPGRDRGLGA